VSEAQSEKSYPVNKLVTAKQHDLSESESARRKQKNEDLRDDEDALE